MIAPHFRQSSERVENAARLRKSMSEEEVMLWVRLRKFRRNGWAFRKQAPVGPYVADFLCRKAMLVIEVDGSQHDLSDQIKHDLNRDEWMTTRGYIVLRFSISEIRTQIDTVLDTIEDSLQASRSETIP